jgi:carbamoylphosphate synthase large subunit
MENVICTEWVNVMNILLLGAGRRVSLINRFKNAGFKVAIYENETNNPASFAANDYSNIFSNERQACSNFPWYLACMDKLTILDYPNYIGSPFTASYICYDKAVFEHIVGHHFKENYPSCRMWDSKIIKPRFGNSSKGFRLANWNEDFDYKNEIMQKKLTGTEYSVDCYFSRESKFIGGVTRKRLRVAGGEVIDSQVDMNYEMLELTAAIGEFLNMKGPACFQYMLSPEGDIHIFEINARLGGGVILAMEAGLDIPSYIQEEYYLEKNIQPIDLNNIKNELIMRRVNTEYFFNV